MICNNSKMRKHYCDLGLEPNYYNKTQETPYKVEVEGNFKWHYKARPTGVGSRGDGEDESTPMIYKSQLKYVYICCRRN